MLTTKYPFTLAVLGIAAATTLIVLFGAAFPVKGEIDSARCTPTSYKKTVGHQAASTILDAAGNRAWARIEQPTNATSSVALGLDGVAPAIGTGINLDLATSTPSGQPFIEFGRNADFPYVGAVTGLASTGSTTVEVVECLY